MIVLFEFWLIGVLGMTLFIVGTVAYLAVLAWYLWAMARLFSLIGLPSREGWLPVWNQWKLLDQAGLPGWIALLNLIGLGVIPWAAFAVVAYRLGKEHGLSDGYTVLSLLLPPLWATLAAQHIAVSRGGGLGRRAQAAHAQPGYLPPDALTHGSYAAAVTADLSSLPETPMRPHSGAFPWSQLNAAPTANAADPGAAFTPPQIPWPVAAQPATRHTAPAMFTDQAQAPLGSATEAEYERLAAQGFQAPPAVPLGPSSRAAAFAWGTAAAAPIPPAEAEVPPAPTVAFTVPPSDPIPPAPAVHQATGITGAMDRDALAGYEAETDHSFATPDHLTPYSPQVNDPAHFRRTPAHAIEHPDQHAELPVDLDADQDTDLDHTIVMPRRTLAEWVLELADGSRIPLHLDSIVGRRPTSQYGATPVPVPDLSRTLSKSHARLIREGDHWLVEDLGSTNGLVLLNDDGTESELQPGVRAVATERMLFGTLEVRLRPSGGME